MTQITIPESVTSIENGVFLGCSSLIRIDVAEDNKEYTSLDGVVFSKTFAYMIVCPEGKFGEVAIPEGVPWVQTGIFSGCPQLTKVKIPASVTSIGNRVFEGCSHLTHIDVEKDNTTYASMDGVSFDKALSQIIRCPEGKVGTLAIPASITSIERSSFYNCANLISILFEGNAPTQVGKNVFNNLFNRTPPRRVIYYREGTTGWTNPWQGIKTQMILKD